LGGRKGIRPVKKQSGGGADVVVCLEQGADYLHVNSMTYTLFFIPDYQFQKVFFMFP